MKRIGIMALCVLLVLSVAGCTGVRLHDEADAGDMTNMTAGQETDEDGNAMDEEHSEHEFRLDNVLDTEEYGEVHYNLYVPIDYDGSQKYALHIALPGWEGLYFQGVGEDLHWEYMPHESIKYVEDMIVVSLQLNSWDENSAQQTVKLTEYMMGEYSIDTERVYITGYSAGGETLSHVMELKPELYRAALFMSSKWDGDLTLLVAARTRLYLFTSEHDSYYGAEPARQAWQNIYNLYESTGVTEEEIHELLVLDIREDAWFDEVMKADADRTGKQYATDYHGAGMLAAFDEEIMRWIFR